MTVGAYNAYTMAYAPFSGRGDTRYPEKRKPDLAAPGVDITAPRSGRGLWDCDRDFLRGALCDGVRRPVDGSGGI